MNLIEELRELIEKWDGLLGTPKEEIVDALETAVESLVEEINGRD